MKIDVPHENEAVEFKSSLHELDKGIESICAMLNKSGHGKVYFGVKDDGTIIGVKDIGQETIKKIGTRFIEGVKPQATPRISYEAYGDLEVIVLEANGDKRPYSSFGDYRIRVGSENRKIDPDELGDLFFTNSSLMADKIEAFNQDLTFTQLKALYIARGLTIDNKTFEKNMGLINSKGRYNYIAELLADSNNISIKVVRFSGRDKTRMVSRNEYGFQCMLIAMRQAYDYVVSLNETRVNLDSDMERKETRLFDPRCFDEAWTNACLHNRWVRNIPPAIYIFDDRIEITSSGGLPLDFDKEEFFAGISHPINIPLQKIMLQLGLVEQTGHGVPTILAQYGFNAFDLGDNHITVTIPFAFTPSMKQVDTEGLGMNQAKALKVLKDNPAFTIQEIAETLGIGKTSASALLKDLKSIGRISRIGSNKSGYWKVS